MDLANGGHNRFDDVKNLATVSMGITNVEMHDRLSIDTYRHGASNLSSMDESMETSMITR